jgi:hypothetical protein
LGKVVLPANEPKVAIVVRGTRIGKLQPRMPLGGAAVPKEIRSELVEIGRITWGGEKIDAQFSAVSPTSSLRS